MSGEHNWNAATVKNLTAREGNGTCADCRAPDPQWASHTLGIFLCVDCSGIHRNLPEISKVKSLIMDNWDDTQVQFLASHGNIAAKAIYEAHVPVYYYRPKHTDCHVLREQWIRSKYERKEFIKPKGNISNGSKEGNLLKRGRDNGQYLPRKFFLSEIDGTLKYFTKPDEIVSWFNAIRSAQFSYMQIAFPKASDKEIISRLTRNFLKEGYMEKTGPKQTDGFKKRWFTLDHRRLMYFKDPLDAFAKGELFLGSSQNGYEVKPVIVPSTHGNCTWNYGISITTPERTYLFTCESESERENWLLVFKEVISQPMTVREFSVEAQFKTRS
eukprot:XP_017948466.1 PREDICTED: arfGAP with dual PH domains 1 isoform X3 [Xenopus tropicalis]